jgi:hypothetical protein
VAARGGRLDVARQLARLAPEEFDEWVAYNRIEADGVDRLAQILKLGFAAVCAAGGMRVDYDSFDPLSPEKLEKRAAAPVARPPARPAAIADGELVSPEAAAAFVAAMFPGQFEPGVRSGTRESSAK